MKMNRADREAHVALWRESGLSKAAYCREHHLPYQSFVQWSRCTDADGPEAAGGFLELHDDRPSSDAGAGCVGGGVRAAIAGVGALEFAAHADPEWIASVVRAVVARC